MFSQLAKSRFIPLVFFAIAFSLYTLNNQGTSINILDEVKNSECAREMFEKGDWVVPTFNYELRTDKPPLHYFFMIAGYHLFGVNEYAARFFSGLFGALTILITFLYTRKFTSARQAFWTTFVLLSSMHLAFQFHLAVPDPYLIFFITWSLFLFFDAVKSGSLQAVFLLYLAIGFGSLSKGPVAIALPGLIFLLFLIFSRNLKWTTIRTLKPWSGVLIVLTIALPWYILVHQQTNGAWTEGFFLKHNLGRFTDKMEGHGGIFLITIAYVLVGMFPFTGFLVQSFRRAIKDKGNDWILFSLIASSVIIGFFAISSTKLPNYTVPSYPFLAILLGNYLTNTDFSQKNLKPFFAIMTGFGILLVAGLYVGLNFDPILKNIRTQTLLFLTLPIGFGLAWYFYKKHELAKAFYTTGATAIVTMLVFFTSIFPAMDRQNPVSKSLTIIQNKPVAYWGQFSPAYSFYLRKPIPEIMADQIGNFFDENPNGILISTTKKLKDIILPDNLEIVFMAKEIFEAPTVVLIQKKTN